MARSVSSWSGSLGTAWPSLAISDGGTAAWNADTYLPSPPASGNYETFATMLSGSTSGYVQGTFNTEPTVTALSQTDRSTDASSYAMPTSNLSGSGDFQLLMVTTCHTADHFHEIDINSSTNGWKNTGVVYSKVAETSWINSTTYFRQTAWVVKGFSGIAGQVRIQTSTAQGQSTYQWTGAAYTSVGTTLTTQNCHATFYGITGAASGSNYTAAIRTANTKYASGASGSGPSAVSLTSDLSYANNRIISYFAKGIGSNPSSTSFGSAGSSVTASQSTINTSPNSNVVASVSGLITTSSATTRRTATNYPYSATWINTTAAWGGFLLELVDAQTAANTDTFPGDNTSSYLVKTATTALADTEVRTVGQGSSTRTFISGGTTTVNECGSPNPLARYCTVSGTTYAVTLDIYSTAKAGATSHNVDAIMLRSTGIVTINTLTVSASSGVTNGLDTLTNRAIRVRNSAGGGLWITIKAWSGSSEPAWPLSEAAASTWAASSVVYNLVDNATASVLAVAGAGTGTAGVVFPLHNPSTRAATETYGSITSYSDLTITSGTATASGSGGISAVFVGLGSASASGVGDLSGSAILVADSAPTLSGTSDLSGSAIAVADSAPTLSGTGGITTTEEIIAPIVEGTATLDGTGTLSATGVIISVDTPSVSGQGNASSDGLLVAIITPTASGTGELAGTGISVVHVTATLSAAGDVVTAESLTLNASSTLTGTGDTAITDLVAAYVEGTLDGAGTLTPASILIAVVEPELAGSGVMAGSGVGIAPGGAALTGTSGGTGSASLTVVATGDATGAGNLAADGIRIVEGSATLAGSGALSVIGGIRVDATASCAGVSAGVVVPAITAFVTGTCAAVATLAATGVGVVLRTGACTGVGGMLVEGKWVHYISNALRETSTRKVAPSVFRSVSVTAEGTVIREGTVTTRKVVSGTFTTEAMV